MEPEYRKIIDRRRDFLLDHITWGPELARALYKEKVLPRQDMLEIERESKPGNRVYMLVARLTMQTEQRTFQRFCKALQTSGYEHVAEVLAIDRSNIAWDFDKGIQIHTVWEYIDVIDDVLLRRLMDEPDEHIKKARFDDIRRRLTQFNRFLRGLRQQKDYFTGQIRKLIKQSTPRVQDSRSESPTSTDESSSDFELDFNDPEAFEEYAKIEIRKDEDVLTELEHALGFGDDQSIKRSREMARYKDKLKEYEKETERLYKQINGNDKVKVLQQTIKNQDMTIMELKYQMSCEEDCVKIASKDFEEILHLLKNHNPKSVAQQIMERRSSAGSKERKSSTESKDKRPVTSVGERRLSPRYNEDFKERKVSWGSRSESPGSEGDLDGPSGAGALRDYVKSTIDNMDTLRSRLKQTSERITELEKERHLVYTAVNASDFSKPLDEAVKKRLTELDEEREELRSQVRNLRDLLEEAEEDRLNIRGDSISPASSRGSSRKSSSTSGRKESPVSSTPLPGGYSKKGPRRLSAPSKPTQPAPAPVTSSSPSPRTPSRRTTVAGCQPKIMQLNGQPTLARSKTTAGSSPRDSPNSARRRKVSVVGNAPNLN